MSCGLVTGKIADWNAQQGAVVDKRILVSPAFNSHAEKRGRRRNVTAIIKMLLLAVVPNFVITFLV